MGEVIGGLSGSVQAIREASPQARHHFTQADQVNQLVGAREAESDLGFMGADDGALLPAPAPTPATGFGTPVRTGPYTLYMTAGGGNKLPFGNLPRLLLAWLSTEAVRTQSRVLVLGASLSEFMRTLGMEDRSGSPRGDRTRLRNQMDRLFHSHVQLIYEDEQHKASVSSQVADRTDLWWNPKLPDEPSLWDSKILLSEPFFNEIVSHPVPLDMNTLKALKRCALGLDLYLWLVYRTFPLRAPATPHLEAVVRPVRNGPGQGQRQIHRPKLPPKCSTGIEEDQAGLAGVELHHCSGPPDPASLPARYPTGRSSPANKLIGPFPASQRPVSGLSASGWDLGAPHFLESLEARKSPISTVLCDSG